jgi:hypothetical protein
MADDVLTKLDELVNAVDDFGASRAACPPPLPFPAPGAMPVDWAMGAIGQILNAQIDENNIPAVLDALDVTFSMGDQPARRGVFSAPGVAGSRATFAAVARVIAPQTVAIIQSLKPLDGRPDCKGYETLIPLITKAVNDIVLFAERPGGVFRKLIANRLATLMGSDGSLAALRERLGLNRCSPSSLGQEGTLDDFNTAAALLGTLDNTFRQESEGTLCGDGHLGTQLFHIRNILAHILEQVKKLQTLIPWPDLATFVLSPADPTTLADFFAWIENVASPRTAETINVAGTDYISFDFLPTLESILAMFNELPLQEPPAEEAEDDDDDKDCGIGALFQRRSVRRAFIQLRCDLVAVQKLAGSIRYCAPVSVTDAQFFADDACATEVWSAAPGATVYAMIKGRNFTAESEPRLFGPDGRSITGETSRYTSEEIRARFHLREAPLGRWDVAVVTDDCCVARLPSRLAIDEPHRKPRSSDK